jgi:hypothetical protein
MAICAVIDNNNILINTIVAETTDLPPNNCRLVLMPDGYYWDGNQIVLIPILVDDNGN